MGSVTLAIAFGAVCTIGFLLVILREESYLEQKFGGTFRDYVARVPRFFPSPRLYRDEAEVLFKPALLRSTFKDGLVFFAPAILFAVLRSAQDDGLVPVLYRLW